MRTVTIQEIEEEVRALLAPHGLRVFGCFNVDGSAALLVGNIGSELWPVFSQSYEYQDDETESLDRWTVRVLTPIAEQLDAEVRFPFGEKIWPFQHYAKAATGMRQSPIGLLIHPDYGLWIAFRGVLVFDIDPPSADSTNTVHPCDTCIEKPCLNTCPIGAFTDDGYDYMACKSYVRSEEGSICFTGGCQARHACPIGQENAYEPDHQAFHMKAFV